MPRIILDDRTLYQSRFSKICSQCQHLKLDPNAFPATCKAFPNGIPAAIWNGENNHTKPYEGDNGIQFEQRSTSPF